MYKKIDKYLSEIEYVGSYEDSEYGPEQLTDRMIDFFMILDPDNLYDDQLDQYMNIMGDFDSYADIDDDWDEGEEEMSEGEVNEAPPLLRKKRDRVARRERKLAYRKKRSQLKTKAKAFRRTAAYKKYVRKKKKMVKRGKTSTGARIRKFY